MELATPRPQNVTGRRDEPARMAVAPRSEILMTDRGPCAQIKEVGAGFRTRGHPMRAHALGKAADSSGSMSLPPGSAMDCLSVASQRRQYRGRNIAAVLGRGTSLH
jgi:hypothetical protein